MKPVLLPIVKGVGVFVLFVHLLGCTGSSDSVNEPGAEQSGATSPTVAASRSGSRPATDATDRQAAVDEGSEVGTGSAATQTTEIALEPESAPKDTAGRTAATNSAATNSAATAAGPLDWASWLGPDGTGVSRETGLVKTFPAAGPRILWQVELGTGYSGLSVAGGRVFTLFGKGKGGREIVACFDAATGESLWNVDSDVDFSEGRSPGPRSTPVIDGDHVYALGASGHLQCLTAASGDVVWQYNVIEKFGQRLHEEGLSPTPVIDGRQLLIQAGRSIFSLDKLTGNLLWKALDEPMNHATPMIRTIGGQRQLVVLTGHNLVGLSPADGRELWRHAQAGVNVATPVVGPDDRIFSGAAYGYGCQLIQVSGGATTQIYQSKVLAPHTATPILFEGHLYGFDDRGGIFKCVEFVSGAEKWSTRATPKGNIIIADGQFILINEAGELLLAPVSPLGFEPTAKARLFRDGLCYTAPSLANGRLYVRSDREAVCILMKP